MNHYRQFYNKLIEVKFNMMDFKLRNNTTESFQAMQSLTEAIVLADERASEIEWSRNEAKRCFNESKLS